MVTVALLNEFVFMMIGVVLGYKFYPFIKFVFRRYDEVKSAFMDGYSKQ